MALLLGRALDAQKFFHDVNYEHRLRDSSHELYQFNMVATQKQKQQQEEGGHVDDNNSNGNNPSRLLHGDADNIAEDLSSVNFTNEYDHNNKSKTDYDGMPNGVFTVLTDCYSPTCSRGKFCYSVSCPRRLEQTRTSRRPAYHHVRSSSKSSLLAEEV